MEQTEQQDIPGILLLLDFRKAFDTIEWSFIQQTLSLFNFGPWLIMDSQHNFFLKYQGELDKVALPPRIYLFRGGNIGS